MKYTKIKMRLQRNVRHARYQMSEIDAELTVQLEPSDDLAAVYEEIYDDLSIIVEAGIEEEERRFDLIKRGGNLK